MQATVTVTITGPRFAAELTAQVVEIGSYGAEVDQFNIGQNMTINIDGKSYQLELSGARWDVDRSKVSHVPLSSAGAATKRKSRVEEIAQQYSKAYSEAVAAQLAKSEKPEPAAPYPWAARLVGKLLRIKP